MTAEEHFYLERDRRTRESGVSHSFDLPVRVVVGRDAAASAAGQTAVLALINMLAHIHRHLQLDIPSANLLSPALVPATRLDDASRMLARAIDPFIRLDTGPSSRYAIGLGGDVPPDLPWYAGAQGQTAIFDRRPVAFGALDGPSLGAALAACLASAAVLRQALGQDQHQCVSPHGTIVRRMTQT